MNKNNNALCRRLPAVALAVCGLGANSAALAQAADQGAAAEQPQPVGQAPEETSRPEDVSELFDNRGVLTPRNSLVLEPSLSLSYSSSNRVAIEAFTILPAIAVGLIDVREVRRETLTAALSTRYGITNRLEFELRVPYVSRRDEVRQRQLLEPTQDDVIIDSSGSGLGDIEASLHYQLNQPAPGRAYYIANLRGKSRSGEDVFEVDREVVIDDGQVVGERLTEQPTGSGFWAVEPSLTLVFPTDPAVFFGNIGYTWNLARDVGNDIGRVDPGDFLSVSFGMGFGVNENTSFSLGYDHTVVFDTEYEDIEVADSEFDRIHVGNLLIGFSHQFAPGKSVNVSLGVGVTEDAPDVQLTLKMPFRLF